MWERSKHEEGGGGQRGRASVDSKLREDHGWFASGTTK